jgi:hypothetical protein
MFSVTTLALALGAPVALVVAWLGFVRRGPGRAWAAPFVTFSGVAAVALACAAAAVLWEQSSLVPASSAQALGWFALAWGLAAAAEAAALRADPLRHVLRVVVLTVLCVHVFGKRLEALAHETHGAWPGSGAWMAFGVACGVAALCELFERLHARLESGIVECVPLAAALGAAALSLCSGYATLASVAGTTAAILSVLALGAWSVPNERALTGGLIVFATGWTAALALAGGLFGAPNFPGALWAAIALGAAAPAVVSLRAFESFGRAGRFALAAALALTPIAFAAWYAYGTYETNPYS